MAPGRLTKRRRRSESDDESEDDSSRDKRSRLSPSQDSDDVSSDDDQQGHGKAPEQDDTEAYFSYQTQRIEKQLRNSELRQNIPSESGIIQEVSCTNFMCHAQLTVPLGPLINFIIGHNGSGKSAVLTALVLCLGGKASSTNRGTSLKSFIKEGTDHCTIRVKIKNEGPNAYRPEQYGSSIYVERHFSRSGSGFKLRDENKKVVSAKKQDLEDILDTFAMQLDNPMNVLTQDMARQFLNDSTPKDKYKFFLKGTQLETLQKDYELITQLLNEMEAKSEIIQEDEENLKKRFEVAMNKARRAERLKTMKEKEHQIAHQWAWAQVEAEEAKLAEIDQTINNVSEIIETREREADQKSEEYDTANQAFSEANQSLQDLQANLGPKQEECEQLAATFNETKTELYNLQKSKRDIGGKISQKNKLIEKYKRQIEEQRQRQAEADGGQHAHKLAELETAKEEVERARQEISNHDGNARDLQKDLQEARRNVDPAESAVRRVQQELRDATGTLRDLEQGDRDWTRSYPNPANLPKLLKAIESERGFRERPVGPMGRHVKLLKPEWSSILEKSSGSSLNSFVVTSREDQVLLSSIMRRMNCQYPVMIGRSNRIDTANNEPDQSMDTWLRALRVDNDLVRNQLIINHRVEQIVLISDRNEGINFMFTGGRKQNVAMCFTHNDNDPNKGHQIHVNPRSGAETVDYIEAYRSAPRMQIDKESQIRAARSNIERLQRDFAAAKDRAGELKAQLKACEDRLSEHSRRKRSLTIRLQEAESNYERLEVELSAATPDSGELERLQEELTTAEEEKTFELGQYEDNQNSTAELNIKLRSQKDELEAVQAEISQINIEIGKLQSRADKLASKREQYLAAKNHALEQAELARENKAEWEQARGSKLEEVQQIQEEAAQISPRVEVPRGATAESLHQKLARLRREREAIEQDLGGSEDELMAAAAEARLAWDKKQQERSRLNLTKTELKKSLLSRENRWRKFRGDISNRASIIFSYLLASRNFRGTLKVDHKNQLLDIHVQPDSTVLGGHQRQTKTLSGGEKSFSTICLLLSLWDAMGSPIRCLDEFDVFMDAANRSISMKLMIDAARRAIGRQYILITPQAMNDIDRMEDVKIIKMRDPERGQTALNVSR